MTYNVNQLILEYATLIPGFPNEEFTTISEKWIPKGLWILNCEDSTSAKPEHQTRRGSIITNISIEVLRRKSLPQAFAKRPSPFLSWYVSIPCPHAICLMSLVSPFQCEILESGVCVIPHTPKHKAFIPISPVNMRATYTSSGCYASPNPRLHLLRRSMKINKSPFLLTLELQWYWGSQNWLQAVSVEIGNRVRSRKWSHKAICVWKL